MAARNDLPTRLVDLAMDATTLAGLAAGLDILLNDLDLGPNGAAEAAVAAARTLTRDTSALAERLDQLSAEVRRATT